MNEETKRTMWARGLTPYYRGKVVQIGDGKPMLMRGVEHFDNRTVITAVVEIEVGHRDEVSVYDH